MSERIVHRDYIKGLRELTQALKKCRTRPDLETFTGKHQDLLRGLEDQHLRNAVGCSICASDRRDPNHRMPLEESQFLGQAAALVSALFPNRQFSRALAQDMDTLVPFKRLILAILAKYDPDPFEETESVAEQITRQVSRIHHCFKAEEEAAAAELRAKA